jgi:hypothetical protein
MTRPPPHAKPERRQRADGWTVARRVAFLDLISLDVAVAPACLEVGVSRQSAYRLRARCARFAEDWEKAESAARSLVWERPATHRGPIAILGHIDRRPPPDAASLMVAGDFDRFLDLMVAGKGDSFFENL